MHQLYIKLKPQAGLCNRMRTISSAIYIASKLSARIDIFWTKDSGCNVKFNELFEPINLNIPIRIIEYSGFYYRVSCKRNLYIPSLLRRVSGLKEIKNFNCRTSGDIFSLLPKSGKIFIQSCHSLCELYDLSKIFKPIDEIQKIINNITNNFTENTIGLHIRRTDNIKSIEHNNIIDFINYIKDEITLDKNVKFYLATDDIKVKSLLEEMFKSNIISYEAPLCRNSIDGMKAAVVDLWCLSKTKKIIGSFYSSYSEIASELSMVELKIL